MRKLLFVIFILFFAIFYNTQRSESDVLIENGGTSFFRAAFIPGVMELDVDTGAGQVDDYVLLTCGAYSNSSANSFNAPGPAIFTELDTENCGASNNCIEGIWGGFTSNAASETLTCNTTGTSIIFNATTLRYSNVDPMNPVIGIACAEGNGLLATAPSIATEAGSQVVRIFTSFAFVDDTSDSIIVAPQMASFDLQTTLEGLYIATIGTSDLFNTAGATGTADLAYTGLSPRDWRACTIALRMLPIVQFTLDVTKSGDGDGTVTSMPAGIDCGGDCTNLYDVDTLVELTAVPDANSVFVQWSGDCMGTDPTTTVTMDADRTCDAEFALIQRTLTLNKLGTGTGNVTSMPAGIDCGTLCNSDSSQYNINEMVTMAAVADPGSLFEGWGGDCSADGLNSSSTVTLDVDRTCTALFTVILTPTPTPQPTPTPTMTPAPPTDIPPPTPTIIPPPDVTSVPTLGQWGHLSVGIFAVLIGVWFLRRHRVKA